MVEHVNEGAWRGQEPMKTQPMVSTTLLGKNHSNDICANEKLL